MYISTAFVRDKIIRQTFIEVLPAKFDTPEAEVMLLAIGLQESKFQTRQQYGGPARSFWQMEKGGGVRGVLSNADTFTYARMVCAHRAVMPTVESVFARLLDDDLLGCGFARLILWADPDPLPTLGDADSAWLCYLKNWRPGRPHPADWPANYASAIAAQAA
jgi:hypothetical protein